MATLLLAATCSFVPAALGRAPECSPETVSTHAPEAEARLAASLVAPGSVVRVGHTPFDGAVAPRPVAAADAAARTVPRGARRAPDPSPIEGREICLRNGVLLI